MRSATDLLDAALAGDAAAREDLVTRHLDTVRAVCGSRLRSPHDVADATQETFVRAFARLDQVRDADRLDAWLRAIAARVCADQGRHLQRSAVVADPLGDRATGEPGPDELVLAGEEAERLHATLATLGRRDRQALWLRDAIGLPVAHVAADLGVTEGSARVLLARARDRLRTAFEGAAAIAAVGLLRVRGRLAGLTGVDARVALAAQLAIVAVAVAVVPGIDVHGGSAPVPAPGSAAPSVVAVTPVASVRADAQLQDGRAAGTPAHAAPADPDDDATSGAGGRPPAPVELATTPPAGPSRFGVAASDGDGEVAGVEAWGGPVSELLGADAVGPADGSDPGADDDEDDGSSGLPVGPVEVVPGDGGR